jgi:hypothetical protein
MQNQTPNQLELLFRIIDRVEVLNEKISRLEIDRALSASEMNGILIKQEHNLAVHIKRTDIAEASIELLKNEIKPVLQGLGFLKTIVKIVTFLTGVAVAFNKFKK